MNLLDAIAVNVKARRLELGLTRAQLAARSPGLGPDMLALIEDRQGVVVRDLPRLCIALGVDLRQLVAGADEYAALFPDRPHAGPAVVRSVSALTAPTRPPA